MTDQNGIATIAYPHYRYLDEQIGTTSVSLHVDHPDFACLNHLHIDVPLETDGPYEVKLADGVAVNVRPTIDGKPCELANIFAPWSDGRSWTEGAGPEKRAGGVLNIPAMPAGRNAILLVMLDGDRATHFSRIEEFELKPGEPKTFALELRPAVRVKGALGANVPRPVASGRIKAWSLNPPKSDSQRVRWWSWAPVQADGTFEINWPEDVPIQIIALCDGYSATSGSPPAGTEYKFEPGKDPFSRPHVFAPQSDKTIELPMQPLVDCVVTTVDEDDEPVASVKVMSWPNVGWWNGGSQIYCDPMAGCERMLRERDYEKVTEKVYPYPFEAETNAQGKATLHLLPGREFLSILSGVYEMPVFLGHRHIKVTLSADKPYETTLRLQPRGTEKLGEWDKLAGVVFGCSTRAGRRICALPGVRQKMDEFAELFREGKNQRDPKLLAEAYTAVADAFVGVGDEAEAAKWRQKADEQAKLAGKAANRKAVE